MICARFSFPTGVFRACTRRSTVFRSSSLSSRNRRLISSLSLLACPSPFSKYIIVAGCTTKIMTAIVAIENGNLDQGVTVEQAELNQVPAGSSNAGLVVGDYFRLHTLLYALMLRSGTDASIVVARVVAGSTANFVAMMNRKAQALHLLHTHFSSPHGFSSNDHYSSAADMVTLANYAMRNPIF